MKAPSAPSPRDPVRSARRIVVKLGSRLLVDRDNRLDEAAIGGLVDQMAAARAEGRQIVCVSSGAIAAGLPQLGLRNRPADLPSLQAAAAIGQARLMSLYREHFGRHGLHVAQVLLTHADLRSRDRHLNARHTFSRLLEAGVIPIVNENDTVAVEEIRFGDNDALSALVAMLLRADLLVLLTTVEGLHARPDGSGPLIEHVARVTGEIRAMAGGAGSAVSIGGMQSKLEAAAMVSSAGESCVIASGRRAGVLAGILAGEPIGTAFAPIEAKMAGRKRWIAFFERPQGDVRIDEGAARAVRDKGGSLLPIGVTAVTGTFGRGAPVRLLDPGGTEIARGLVNYAADDLRRLAGRRSTEIAAILGACEYAEVVHRDNMVMR